MVYVARIELHGAESLEYILLHIYLAQQGFSRQIVSDEGVTYQLPSGTYSIRSDLPCLAVQDIAMEAARKAQSNSRCPMVLVSQGSHRWEGLPVVSPKPNIAHYSLGGFQ